MCYLYLKQISMVRKEIGLYERGGSKFIHAIDCNLTIEELSKIFAPKNGDDVLFYEVYPIDKEQYEKLRLLIPELAEYDLKNFEMFLESYQEE